MNKPSVLDRLGQGTSMLSRFFDTIRKVDELKDEVKQLDVQRQLLDLERLLYDAEREILDLNRTVDALKKKESDRLTLTFDQGMGVYTNTETGIHYCTKCYHSENSSLVPLANTGIAIYCKVCNTTYKQPPSTVFISRGR